MPETVTLLKEIGFEVTNRIEPLPDDYWNADDSDDLDDEEPAYA